VTDSFITIKWISMHTASKRFFARGAFGKVCAAGRRACLLAATTMSILAPIKSSVAETRDALWTPLHSSQEGQTVRLPTVGLSDWHSTDLASATFTDPLSQSNSVALENALSRDQKLHTLNCNDQCCDQCDCWHWADTLSLFIGLEGSKQPQDFGVNAQFGGRTSVNWGAPLVESWGLGAQIGTSLNATADAVQVMQRTEGTSGRTQNFTTVGLFQRSACGWDWAVAYDYLFENYYDRFDLGQWRLKLAYEFNPTNELGVWATISDRSDNGQYANIPVTLRPISQTNIYYRHTWRNCIDTTIWGGVADKHGQVNAVLGDLEPLRNQFTFGADLYIPLSDHLAIYGQGNFITPASSGTVDSYLGLEYFPRGGARMARQAQFAPLLPVAGSPTFATDLSR
jgi:hypothetical protein